MKFNFKVSENSLFAILLRSSWWISFAVALLLLLLARLLVPEAYLIPASSLALPFLVIGGIVAWKQSKLPSQKRIAATVEAVTAMTWREFSALMEQAYLREGYRVAPLAGPADFRLDKTIDLGSMGKKDKTALVCCKRWKAASHGLEPLRELDRQLEAENAHEAFYVALEGVTDKARDFAGKHRIHLIGRLELTALLRLPRRAMKTDKGKK
ncbi:MAG: restriction endonuclease [Candidatus Accumulibacter sp.]|nr:restriction endonuclease [Accumulibacter sp.]